MSDLIKQQTEVKPGESATQSQSDRARMMEEAQRVVQEMRERGCAAQRGRAGREQEDAHHCEIFLEMYSLVVFWRRGYAELMSEMVHLLFGSSP